MAEDKKTTDENTKSVPENGVSKVETLEVTDTPIGREADAKRTKEDVKFADESNPNKKARDAGAPGEEYDQDGNVRGGGYSYGVANDDTHNTVPEDENKGRTPEQVKKEDGSPDEVGARLRDQPIDAQKYLNQNSANDEWNLEKQRKTEADLSDPKAGISARLTTSAGNYVRVKFLRNNKPMGIYKSRDFKVSEAKSFLSDLRKELDV